MSEGMHKHFDSEASMREALSRFPIERVLEQYGHGPLNGSWKRIKCPFCERKTSAGLFESTDGSRLFKCHWTSCSSETKAMGPVQLLARFAGLSERDAFVQYLKMAGVWRERENFRDAGSMPKEEGDNGVAPSNGEKSPSVGVAAGAGANSQSPIANSQEPKPSEAKAGAKKDHRFLTSSPTEQSGTPGTASLPASETLAPQATSKIVNLRGEPVAAPKDNGEKGEKGENEEPDGRRCLRDFYEGLKLLEPDEKKLFERRGLESRTSALLGFRSNPKQNRIALLALPKRYDWEELAASGLWLREDRQKAKKRRPNVKFSGFGISGRNDKGEWTYAWNNPVLIPYFDEKGVLVSLRPHKDMGPGGTVTGTPHVYVPRRLRSAELGLRNSQSPIANSQLAEERFDTVVITEGEFKAAALWQLLGAGRSDGGVPIGVCALPGISFGKNYEIREELDGWLRAVKARRVIVIYDNEDKANPKLESFKPDKRKRYDAVIWARYLATDLAHKVHVRGEVSMLPVDWRDAKGKADWDGALCAVREGRIK